MTHLDAEILDALAYGMLEEELRGHVAEHLASCAHCADSYQARCSEAADIEHALAAEPVARGRPLLRWVAAALVLLATSSFFWADSQGLVNEQGLVDEPGTELAGVDVVEPGLHRLRDGSLVHASAGVEVLGWREVAIGEGDFFFDVAPRPDMPFLVRTPSALVKVVGTKFRLYVERKSMNTKSAVLLAVAVVSGAVIVSNSLGTVDVQPGQEVVVEQGKAPERVGQDSELGPVLVSPSPQQHMARLERELLAAKHQIAELQKEMDGVSAGEGPDLADPRVLATAQTRFFKLKAAYTSGTAGEEEMAELLKLSKSKPIMSFIVKGLEKKIADDPEDLEARLQLANVESSRVHMAESITERAMLGRNVREQISEVLKRDPENWQGRFMKAVGISHSQRTPQGRANAIREFESLLTIQASRPSEPKFAQTYGQLAIVYMAERDTKKAREVLTEGLASYPDAKDLKDLMTRLTNKGN